MTLSHMRYWGNALVFGQQLSLGVMTSLLGHMGGNVDTSLNIRWISLFFGVRSCAIQLIGDGAVGPGTWGLATLTAYNTHILHWSPRQ